MSLHFPSHSISPPLSLSAVNPVIDFPLSDASVQTDSTISFACYANTSNNVNLPLIRWTKDGVNINTNTPRIDVQTEWSRVSTLLIANVMLEDAGVYSCVSSNSAVTRASLTVVGKHVILIEHEIYFDSN